MIQDDGPGITPGQEELIFEPFVTLADQGTGANPGSNVGSNVGSGLGLSIARQAVIVHGGRIVARASESGGLAVIIELPVDVR